MAELPRLVHRGMLPAPTRVLPVPAALRALWGEGIPRGRVSEIVGALSSGRTSLLYALLAAATASREVTAVVDLPNAFDPVSAQQAHIDLGAVLWVRPPSMRASLRCTELILSAGGFGLVILDLEGTPLRRLWLSVWPRLARAAERSATALVVLAPHRLAGSFAALSVAMERATVWWQRADSAAGLFEGFHSQGRTVRSRFGPVGETHSIEFRLAAFELAHSVPTLWRVGTPASLMKGSPLSEDSAGGRVSVSASSSST